VKAKTKSKTIIGKTISKNSFASNRFALKKIFWAPAGL